LLRSLYLLHWLESFVTVCFICRQAHRYHMLCWPCQRLFVCTLKGYQTFRYALSDASLLQCI